MTLTHRPCGACGALVTPVGCQHWHPHQQVDDSVAKRRAHNAAVKKRQRERGKAAKAEQVAQFQRQMGVRQ